MLSNSCRRAWGCEGGGSAVCVRAAYFTGSGSCWLKCVVTASERGWAEGPSAYAPSSTWSCWSPQVLSYLKTQPNNALQHQPTNRVNMEFYSFSINPAIGDIFFLVVNITSPRAMTTGHMLSRGPHGYVKVRWRILVVVVVVVV